MTKSYCPICEIETETASDVGACSICGWDGETKEEFELFTKKIEPKIKKEDKGTFIIKGFERVKKLHDDFYDR